MRSRHSRWLAVSLVAVGFLILASLAWASSPASAPSAPLGAANNTDVPVQGTAWVAEVRGHLSLFRPYGWGTEVKRKTAGSDWFHIHIPVHSVEDGSTRYVTYIEFCYKTSNTATYVNRMDIWNNGSSVASKNLSAPADTAYHCYGYTFSTKTWFESVGLSVRGTFANSNDKITLYKAWARCVP